MPKPCRSGLPARPADPASTIRPSTRAGGTNRSTRASAREPVPEPLGPAPLFQHVSTHDVPADSRLDYWRKQFPATRLERSRPTGHGNFHGDIVSTSPWQDVLFADLDSDPVTSHFGTSENGVVLLGCVRSGVVHIRHGRDATLPVDENTGLLLFDCDRPFTTLSQRCTMTYLALPRNLVAQALGCEPVSAHEAVRVMPASTLASGYLRHLRQLAASARALDGEKATHALHTARSLAITLLANRKPHWRSLPGDFDDALLAAAKHLLTLHASNPKLTAGRLAHMLGCSRAHLYRLFERAGATIAGELLHVRMHRARALLQSNPHEPIGSIAWHCGYTDFSAFGKAFRRHFDMTPTDCRQLAADSA